jgi:hypothetical protein
MRTRGYKSKNTDSKNSISRVRLPKKRLSKYGEYTELTNEDMRNIIKGSGVMYGGAISKAKKADLIKGLDHIKRTRGSGFLDNLISRVKNVGSKIGSAISNVSDKVKSFLFFSPNKLPPSAKSVFDKYAQKKIKYIQIRRIPLQSAIRKFLDFVSFGALSRKLKELNYDEIFHLSMYITFEDGSDITVEKNQRIAITEGYPYSNKEGMQAKDVDPSLLKDLTLDKLLGEAQKKMGDFDFFQYSAENRNCQDFVNGILNANGLNNANLREFIKQDAKQIFESMPEFMKQFSQGITDLAGKAQQVIEGGKKTRKKRTKRTKK